MIDPVAAETPAADRFQILEPLGVGGSARVFMAHDRHREGGPVALKLLRSPGRRALRAARREFGQLARLAHPHVVEVYDLGRLADGTLFLTAELIEGKDLLTWSRGRDLQAVATALIQVCRALQYLHDRQIVHGDLKPENMLVSPSLADPVAADRCCVKLVDFGLAAGQDRSASVDGEISGTPKYMAPELLDGASPDSRTDLFSLGVLIEDLLSGIEEPRGLRSVQRWLTAEAPEHRPRCAGDVIASLEHEMGQDYSLSTAERAGAYFPTVPFVGRQEEIEEVERLERGVVMIRGPRGAGKTSLLREIRVRALLDERPCFLGPELADGAKMGPWPSLHISGDGALDRAIDILLTELCRAGDRPLLLLDDVPADDELGLRTLERLRGGGTIVCCAVVREQDWCDRHQRMVDGGAVLVELGGLDPPELEWMLRCMLPGVDLPSDRVAEIHSATRGQPRIVEELIRSAIETGRLGQEGQLDGVDVRSTDLGRLAADRVDHLDPAALQELTGLALFVHGAPPGLGPGPDRLAIYERRGLTVRSRGGLPRVASPWLRRTLLERLESGERSAGHRRVARALAAIPVRSRSQQLELAEQLAASGQVAPAAREFLVAARSLAEGFYLMAAAATFRRAADISAAIPGEESPLHQEALGGLATILRTVGSFEEAAAIQRGQLAHAREAAAGPLAVQVELELVETLVAAGRHDDVPARLARLCDRRTGESAARGRCLWSRALIQRGEYRAAEEQALAGAAELPADGTRLLADLQHLVGLCRMMRGDDEEAMVRFDGALETYRQLDHLHSAARAINSRAMLLQRQGELDAASRAYEEALTLFEQTRDPRARSLALLNLGTAAQQRGLLAEALQRYRSGRNICRELGHDADHVRFDLNLGNLMIQLGDLDEARRLLRQARTGAARRDIGEAAAHADLFRAEAALLRGDADRAAHLAASSEAAFEPLGLAGSLAEVRLLRAEIALHSEVWDEAFERLPDREALEALPEAMTVRRLRVAGNLQLLRPGGDRRRGLLWLQEALLLADGGPDPVQADTLRRQIHRDLAAAASDPAQRDYHLGREARALEALRSRIPEPYLPVFDQLHAGAASSGSDHEPADQTLLDLLRINQELTREHRPGRVLELIVDRAIDLTGAERGFVILATGAGDLKVAVARNLDQESLRRRAFKFSRSVAEQAMATGAPVITDDATQDDRFRSQMSIHEMNLRSILCLPLCMQQRTLGALYLDNRFRRGSFSDQHRGLLQAFADQAAIALHNARLMGEAEQRNLELASAKAEVESLNDRLQATVSAQAEEIDQMSARLGSEQRELIQRYRSSSSIVGRSKGMCEIFQLIDRVAQTAVPVLIQGETGTGKELIAKAIHYNSPRRRGPFVSINCAAIPATLLESELFGHVRGAFTGAIRDKRGLFEVASGGTLLLDEIGDMPVQMQAKLLRVLQEGAFRRVGEQEERRADVRILSASLHDLGELAEAGRFREDLMYRLNVVVVKVPPLRKRSEDIPELIQHFLSGLDVAPRVTPPAMARLLGYAWPGNVRELHNELLRASALSEGQITTSLLSERLRASDAPPMDHGSLATAVAAAEKEAILGALEQARGTVTRAARLLGISRVVLHRKIRKHDIQRKQTASYQTG